MNKQTEIIEYLWQIGWFKEFRSNKDVEKKILNEWGIVCSNIVPILKLKQFKKKIKKFDKGWREIRPSNIIGIKKDSESKEIEELLGDAFKKELEEFKIVSNKCPNCVAFLMRKIFEKLLFIVLSKSDKHEEIKKYKLERGILPPLSELISLSRKAEINNIHIISPKTLDKMEVSKFLGDISAHDYLTSVSFEDINQEITYWRIAIRELANNLN